MRLALTAFLALSIPLAVTGCRRSSRTSVTTSTTAFSLDSDMFSEFDDDLYTWETDFDQARVEFRVRHFHEGYARLRIFDDFGNLIFDREYFGDDYYYYDCCYYDEEFIDIASTAIGVPGTWTIDIEYWDFTGHLYLTID